MYGANDLISLGLIGPPGKYNSSFEKKKPNDARSVNMYIALFSPMPGNLTSSSRDAEFKSRGLKNNCAWPDAGVSERRFK